jgi:hypothetical protein
MLHSMDLREKLKLIGGFKEAASRCGSRPSQVRVSRTKLRFSLREAWK